MTKVRKAVIPAAGLGTRFLPATKALAKEMLPIVDKPTIQFIVEEALKSGIEEILVVTGEGQIVRSKTTSIQTSNWNTISSKRQDWLTQVGQWNNRDHLHFIPPKSPSRFRGRCSSGKSLCWKRAFVVMLGDDLMDITNDAALPLTKQLMNDYDETHASTIAVMKVPHEEVSAYGVIAPKEKELTDFIALKLLSKTKPRGMHQVILLLSDATSWLLRSLIFLQIKNQVLVMKFNWRMRSTLSTRPNESLPVNLKANATM